MKSVQIKVALISGSALIIVALIGNFKNLAHKSISISNIQGPVSALQDSTVNIYNTTNNIPEDKLPDGRIKNGLAVSGEPSVVIEEHNISKTKFYSGKYLESLEHSQNAINAYENTEKITRSGGIFVGGLQPQEIGKLYGLGALAAQRTGQKDLACQYAEKSVSIDPTQLSQPISAATLNDFGKCKEALDSIQAYYKIN